MHTALNFRRYYKIWIFFNLKMTKKIKKMSKIKVKIIPLMMIKKVIPKIKKMKINNKKLRLA